MPAYIENGQVHQWSDAVNDWIPIFIEDVARAALSGTPNRIIYTEATGNISTPQDIDVDSVPTFAGLIIEGSAVASQVNVRSSASDNGMYLTSVAGDHFAVSSGVEFLPGAWTARSTTAVIVAGLGGSFFVYTDGGLTIGNSFSPTQRIEVNTSGNLGIGVAPNTSRMRVHRNSGVQLEIGYDAANYAAFTVNSGGSLDIAPIGNITFNPTGNQVDPVTGYDLNLGQLSKKYLTLHAAELWVETLVAVDTMAAIAGRIIIPINATTLIADLAPAATTINVKHNNLANGDRIYMESAGKVEFFAVTSGATGIAGGYSYTVTRNLDGSGANQWYAGDSVLNTGQAGSGFIDIYSARGVKAGTEIGPTIVGNVRVDATYNNWLPHWAIGNLNGIYGYGATTFGAAFGKYSTTSAYVTIDATNGYRAIGGNVVRAQIANDGSGFFANNNFSFTAAGVATISGWQINTTSIQSSTTYLSSGLAIPAGAVAWFGRSNLNSQGIFLRDSGNRYVAMFVGASSPVRPYFIMHDGTRARVIIGDLNDAQTPGGAVNAMGMVIGSAAGTKLVEFSDTQNMIAGWIVNATSISKNEVTIAAGVDYAGTAGVGEAWFGKAATGYYGMVLKGTTSASMSIQAGNAAIGASGKPFIAFFDAVRYRMVLGELNYAWGSDGATNSMGMKIWSAAGVKLIEFSDVQNIIAGWTIGSTKISSTGIDIHSGASAALAFGATPPTSASAGTGIWLDRTGLYGLNAGVVQTKITATGAIEAGAGNVKMDANGIYIPATTVFAQTNAYRFVDGSGNTVGSMHQTLQGTPLFLSTLIVNAAVVASHSSRLWLGAEAGSSGSGSVVINASSNTVTTARLTANYTGVVVGLGADLATTSTLGYFYIPCSAGAPTGVPQANTGSVALHYDRTNNHLYVYNGGWKKTTVFA